MRRFLAGVALTLMLALPCFAAQPDERTVIEELKALEDPTLLKRRVWLDTEWSSFKDSSRELEFTVGGLWAWRLTDKADWALRLKVPVAFHIAGDAAGDEGGEGLGDMKLGAGAGIRVHESLRAAGGLEMRFPTGSEGFSSNVWRPMLFGTVSWDVTRRITLSPSVEYNKSIAHQNGAAQQHFVELFFPATFVLPHRWSITPRYEVKVDFENDNKVTQSGKLSVAKQLEREPLGFALSIKKTFDGGAKKFQLNFVTTYYFR